MILYHAPGSCSLSPHIILEEAGFEYSLDRVDMNYRYSGGNFFDINPKGYVPTLQLDDGEILTEGAAIAQYLADLRPEAKLIPPPGTLARARCVEWLNFIATELHKGFVLSWRKDIPDDLRASFLGAVMKRLSYVDSQLNGRDYLVGDSFTVADAYLFTILTWKKKVNIELDQWKNLTSFYALIEKRPAVYKALLLEGLIEA